MAEKKDVIATAQAALGEPEERHDPQKTSLLKLSVGSLVSDLKLVSTWDDASKSYGEASPAYSIYHVERMVGEDGRPTNKYVNIPIPKNADAFRQIGNHFLQLAEAAEGLELERSSPSVDDLGAALAALKKFKEAK